MFNLSVIRRRGFFGGALFVIAACADSTTLGSVEPSAADGVKFSQGEPNAGSGETKAFIGAWLDGESVTLRYTRSFYCEEPPESIAPTGCEIGALPENFPRQGLIPKIYAIAPAGFTPSDISTVHCSAAAPCANHPAMIDVTRLNIPNVSIGTRPPHSHIITSKQAGWHQTVNIRVLSASVWNQIVASPSLETVRQLQAAYPAQISGDNPTNIFFFFQVHDAPGQ